MKTKISTVKRVALATALLIGCVAVAPAFAGSHVSLNVGIGLPVVGPAYYAPAPVVYAPPPPVYYAPAPVVYGPPAPVYYGPAVGATVVVGHPGYYHRGGYYYRGGYRHYGH